MAQVHVSYIIAPCLHCKNTMYINDDGTKCEHCGNILPLAEAAAYPIRQIITVEADESESRSSTNAKADAIARDSISWRFKARVTNGVPVDDGFSYIPPGSTVVRRDCPVCGEFYRQGFTDDDAVGKQIIEAAQKITRCRKCGGELGELQIIQG